MESEELTEKLEGMLDEEVTQLLIEEYVIDNGYSFCLYKGNLTELEEVIKIDDYEFIILMSI